jgi:hypothetical protein
MVDARGFRWWFAVLWMSVVLLPVFRLPGGIPVRLDDILVFGAFLFLLGILITRDRLPRLAGSDWVLLATAVYILGVTIRGTPVSGASVGAREFLDTIRPLKFLVLVLILDRLRYDSFRAALGQVLPVGLYLVVGFAFLQLVLLHPGSNNPLAQLSLAFSELEEWHVRSLFGYRPFGTFHTPTDLGYFASVTLLAGLLLRDLPQRRAVIAVSLIGVVISGTRTFLFVLPFLLLIHALATGPSLVAKLKRFTGAIMLIAIGGVAVLVLLPNFTTFIFLTLVSIVTGDLTTDQSIVERLENLQLVELTLQTAPLTGVVTRDLMTRGMDSEYFLTLHRYGILGLGLALVLYVAVAVPAWRRRRANPDLGWLTLLVVALTFVYGLTQGALISTRVGVLFFVFVGLERAYARSLTTGGSYGARRYGGGDELRPATDLPVGSVPSARRLLPAHG